MPDDDDSRKHPLKYFCLKCQKKTIFPLKVYSSVSNLSFFVLIDFMQNVGSVFLYFLVTQMADHFQTSTGLSVYVDYIKC